MEQHEKINILLVDDQPAKLLSYNVILEDLGENIIQARNAREALEVLLKTDVALLLVDVCMPDLDGFELASMIREHPRFRQTAIIFISAIHLADADSLRGYQMGAVDYVSVPVVPEILRAKVRVFIDLYRKTKALEQINKDLEERVARRTAELQAAIERQSLLAREVDHRAKNAFAAIQSIVHLTRAETSELFAEAIQGRIRAMARAHSLLSQSRWEGADLSRLIREELAPFSDSDRVQIIGPSILLNPDSAQALAIVIHELATNSMKYGALSVGGGRVHIYWRGNESGLTVRWREELGPSVSIPSRSGFGTKVINASITSQLKGEVKFDWRPEGLVCELNLPPIHMLATHRSSIVTPSPDASNTDGDRHLDGYRVLLVEDEPLVALMMSGILAGLGLNVTGPVGVLGEALVVAEAEFDVAVLDINLAGVLVDPLADVLSAKGVPIVFVTGYESSQLTKTYEDSVIIQKPVDFDLLRSTLQQVLCDPNRSSRPVEVTKPALAGSRP